MLYGDLFFPNQWTDGGGAPPAGADGRYHDLSWGQMVDRGYRIIAWLVPVGGALLC